MKLGTISTQLLVFVNLVAMVPLTVVPFTNSLVL